jgi:hypothetical protein
VPAGSTTCTAELILNRAAACARCETSLAGGGQARRGLRRSRRPSSCARRASARCADRWNTRGFAMTTTDHGCHIQPRWEQFGHAAERFAKQVAETPPSVEESVGDFARHAPRVAPDQPADSDDIRHLRRRPRRGPHRADGSMSPCPACLSRSRRSGQSGAEPRRHVRRLRPRAGEGAEAWSGGPRAERSSGAATAARRRPDSRQSAERSARAVGARRAVVSAATGVVDHAASPPRSPSGSRDRGHC